MTLKSHLGHQNKYEQVKLREGLKSCKDWKLKLKFKKKKKS